MQASSIVPRLDAPQLSYAQRASHIQDVDKHLKEYGVLKITLQFQDSDSKYLEQLLHGLHQHQGHQLPINHSARRGWFWDVRPSKGNFQAGEHQARSETMSEFPWHTDCSYEEPPPRYFALQVLQHDRCGGGTLSMINVEQLVKMLSPAAQAALRKPEFQIDIPPEFIKEASPESIVGSLLAVTPSDGTTPGLPDDHAMRFRGDIVRPLTERAADVLVELKHALRCAESCPKATLHLSSGEDMPAGTILLVDNRRWLHARNEIKDPERHLRRVRWDAVPFSITAV